MGYTLKIGQLKITPEEDDGCSYFDIDVEDIKYESAPAFNEPTDFLNQRWPSYSSWNNFSKFVGLEDFFYNEDYGLLRHHPDQVPLFDFHKSKIDLAYVKFYEKYPNCKAGYSEKGEEDPEWPEENNWACRLEWLKFWVDYALLNCSLPTFLNY